MIYFEFRFVKTKGELRGKNKCHFQIWCLGKVHLDLKVSTPSNCAIQPHELPLITSLA